MRSSAPPRHNADISDLLRAGISPSRLPPPRWLPLRDAGAFRLLDGPSARPRALLGGRLFNRDLSWLRFNERVLEEAADPSVPALERLRFCAIVSSNLDEFFMIRVAEIMRLARAHPSSRFPDGLRPRQALAHIREEVLRQKARQAAVFKDISFALEGHGLRLHSEFRLDDRSLDKEIRAHLPEVEALVRRSGEPLPPLPHSGLHIFVRFPREYAVLRIVERDARLMRLAQRGRTERWALVERWLAGHSQEFFPGKQVVEAFPFKILRDADLRYRPDDDDRLENQIVEAVERRRRARIVRLEVDSPEYSEGAIFLAISLGVDSAALYRFDLPLDLRALTVICGLKGRSRLRYRPIKPITPSPLRPPRTVFETLRRKDILLHHPYDDFTVVERFLQEAARDPLVEAICQTVYRTSRASPLMEALKTGARNGKKVTAYVEIRARFDEMNNLRLAAELRRAGVRVVRPMGRFKVHSKLTQILRREGAELASYVHLGTGNYHPGTARQYTDLGLLTRDATLGGEVGAFFSALRVRSRMPAFRELLVAPEALQPAVLRLIRRETHIQCSGGRGHIIAKMNSLVDPDIIEALYAASRAGVKIDLLVRGICCLRPGIPGLSENIRVISVVDRFLEHSRVFYFLSRGERRVFLSSADWMSRNFHTRYETAFPIKDPLLKKYIREVLLRNSLRDTAKSWRLCPDGSYARIRPGAGAEAFRSQHFFERLAYREYRDTILEKRIRNPAGTGPRPPC